ncbi:hypothetical protein VTO73DRAFT_2031 [Trametes versicolor]
MGISHTVQRATVLRPYAPRVNKTGGTISARCRATYHRQRRQLRAATFEYRAYVTLTMHHGTVSGKLSGRSPRYALALQPNVTTPSHAQAPDCMLCGLDRSSLEVAPAGFIRSITKPGETWRTTTRSPDQRQAARRFISRARRPPLATRSRPHPAGFSIPALVHAQPRAADEPQRGEHDREGSHALRLSTRVTSVRVVAEAEFRWTRGREPRGCCGSSWSPVGSGRVSADSKDLQLSVDVSQDVGITGL